MTSENTTMTENKPVINLMNYISILIAEDDPGHHILTQNCLRNAGISNEILWFEDGQATLDFLNSDAFSKSGKKYILLLDIRMPKIDGIQVLEKIRKDSRYQGVPIIMLTTSDDKELAKRSYELGCDAHIIKPPGETLLKTIQRLNQQYRL
jgi:CheY-like chemotaxis protein